MGALRELWDAGVLLFNGGEIEQLAEGYSDDAVWITPRGTDTGRAAILERYRLDFGAFPDSRLETVRSTEEGNTFVVEYEWVGTHSGPWTMPDGTQLPPSGRQVTATMASVFTVLDGILTEHRQYYDRLPILMQLGLIPTP